MNFTLLSLFLLGFLAFRAHAAPKPRPVKGGDDAYKGSRAQEMPVTAVDSDDQFFAEHRQSSNADDVDDYNYEDDAISNEAKAEAKASDTSARLFIRRFMRLKNNLFGNKKQRIIIQIYPNGTSSVTTVPITNVVVPTNNAGQVTPTSPLTPTGPFRIANDDDNADVDSAQDVAGTIDTQRKGAKKDQDIIVRIPAEYKHLFNNGQQVMLSTNNADNKRRVVNKKRVNKNRKEVNKNKNYKKKNQNRQSTRFVAF